jgi:hypothetical protein
LTGSTLRRIGVLTSTWLDSNFWDDGVDKQSKQRCLTVAPWVRRSDDPRHPHFTQSPSAPNPQPPGKECGHFAKSRVATGRLRI